jgi:hypothetical protein
MVMSKRFPAAIRAIDALAPVHAQEPDKVQNIAALLEGAIQAYGRCLLATAGEWSHDGSQHPRDMAVREAEVHMAWRSRLRQAVGEIVVDGTQDTERIVADVLHNVDHLMYTIDEVLAKRDVHCVSVASGLQA